MKVIYPGSFDPITLGHLNIIERSAKIFGGVDIVLAVNRNKKYMFDLEKRIQMIENSLTTKENVNILICKELIASFAKKNGYDIIIRGFRDLEDLVYEQKMQRINKNLSGIETMFLASDPNLTDISSKNLKEIAYYGGDISNFVPHAILNDVMEKVQQIRKEEEGQ